MYDSRSVCTKMLKRDAQDQLVDEMSGQGTPTSIG